MSPVVSPPRWFKRPAQMPAQAKALMGLTTASLRWYLPSAGLPRWEPGG
jgi:hypothetical protein